MVMTEAQNARLAMRQGKWSGPTVHKVKGYVQANLVVLPRSDAYDFLVYCQRNAKACPVIEVTDPGDPEPRICAPGADLRTDLPRYAVYRSGTKAAEVVEISALWTEDSVAFLLGSSLSFDDALARAGVEAGDIVWALNTTVPTVPAGKFHGNLVVTMRLMSPEQVISATQLTTRYIYTHGSPVHVGDPGVIGADLEHPVYGPHLSSIPRDKTAVFWACGVTPQQAAIESKQELMITHAPGHGFVTDLRSDSFCIP
jgi:uncharacterized protein YcsI (UPF0317 family)